MKNITSTKKLIIFTIIFIALIIWSYFMIMDYKILSSEQQQSEEKDYRAFSSTFELNINNAMTYIYSLRGFVYSNLENTIDPTIFDTFSSETQKHSKFIKNFSVAPNNIQFYVFPLEGNEATLGHDLSKDKRPEVIEAIEDAISTNNITMNGPYSLRQGGLGLVVRMPIFDKSIYWGMVNVVVDIQSIIDDALINLEDLDILLEKNNDVFYQTNSRQESYNFHQEIFIENMPWHIKGSISRYLKSSTFIKLIGHGLILFILFTLITIFILRILFNNFLMSNKIKKLIYEDHLTSLPNRRALNKILDHLIFYKKNFSLAFLDLDGFKDINDNLGHSIGDLILKEISSRIAIETGGNVYRWGGDEFIIVLESQSSQLFIAFLQNILDHMKQPIIIDDSSFSLTCSIGVSFFPQDGKTKDEILKHADATMYTVKKQGKNAIKSYDNQLGESLGIAFSIERKLEEALDHNLLEVFYQPKIDFKTKLVYGFEALVRWQDDQGDYIPPGIFIPIAENTNLIYKLDQFVLESVFKQMLLWKEVGYDIPVSINVSPKHFTEKLYEQISSYYKQSHLKQNILEIEILESVAISNFEKTEKIINKLKKIGVTVALDDFGTGYSALSYLSELNFSTLKIDQSFIAKMTDHNKEYAIIASILNISKALSIKTVAEGVTNDTQWQILKDLGCDYCQGFLFSKALPAEKVIEYYDCKALNNASNTSGALS